MFMGGKALYNYFPSICNHMLQYRRSSSLPSKIHGISCTSPNPSFTEGASYACSNPVSAEYGINGRAGFNSLISGLKMNRRECTHFAGYN
jgi:hypothetical protein